jgi:hypothetical protein
MRALLSKLYFRHPIRDFAEGKLGTSFHLNPFLNHSLSAIIIIFIGGARGYSMASV